MRKARNQLGKKGAEILQEAYQRVFRLKGGQRDDAGVLELVHGLLAKQNPVFASLVDNSFTKFHHCCSFVWDLAYFQCKPILMTQSMQKVLVSANHLHVNDWLL